MWIMLKESTLSVVAHMDQPDCVLVRARVAGDIERAIPAAQVWEDGTADYRYRAVVPREVFAEAVAAHARAIDYPKFKSAVPDARRRNVYLQIWGVLAEAYGAFGRRPDAAD